MNSAPAPDHYSYRHYADPQTAQTFDDIRFGGPIGELIAAAQARVLTEFIAPSPGQTILDVGTGTGRAARLLARCGARVTGVDASGAMLAAARQRADADGVDVTFQSGDAHALDFPDRSFDAAVCLRVLMHTPHWRRCIDELCRVAGRLVVVDYPSAFSVALVESLWRRVAYTCGMRTEPYRVFLPGTITEAFQRNGFRVRSIHRQFVLPIALHKAIRSRGVSLAVESRLQRLGLLAVFGSPVSLVAERCASS